MEIKLHQDVARVERKPNHDPAHQIELKSYSAPQLTKFGNLTDLTAAIPGPNGTEPNPPFTGDLSI